MKSARRATILAFGVVWLVGCGSGAPSPLASQSPSASASVAPSAGPIATTPPSAAAPSGNTSTPQPLALPSASIAETPQPEMPSELQYRWIGPLRDVPQLTPKPNFTGLEVSARTTWFYPYTQGDGPDLRSLTSSEAPNELTFITAGSGTGCNLDDTGKYAYVLDRNGSQLKLTPVSDPCQARSAAFSGDWSKSACPDPRGWCLGDLAEGEQQSSVFTPFIPQSDWKYDYGEMSYTVPTGWTNPEDTPGGYRLEQNGAPEDTAIYFFADVLAHSQAADCPEEPDPTVGTSAADLTDWLAGLPSVTTTDPTPVTIGGLSGSTMDVSVDPSWTRTCSFSQGEVTAPLFSNADPRHGFDWNVAGAGRMRLFLMALPNDRNLVIDIESTDKQNWDSLLTAAMPVVQSLVFKQ